MKQAEMGDKVNGDLSQEIGLPSPRRNNYNHDDYVLKECVQVYCFDSLTALSCKVLKEMSHFFIVTLRGRDVANVCHRWKCKLGRPVSWAKAIAFQRS